jgi:hypothetical protein
MEGRCEYIGICIMLRRSLSPQQGMFSCCRWRKWPPDLGCSCEYVGIYTMLNGCLSPEHGTPLGHRWKRQPPDMDGSGEDTESAAADSQQGVVLSLGLDLGGSS